MRLNRANHVVSVEEPTSKPVKTIHESMFWLSGDPRFQYLRGEEIKPTNEVSHKYGKTVDMGIDSYIWCFVGPRGAGKTTGMTYFAMKCNWLYGCRLVSNYAIEYDLAFMDGTTRHVKSEDLDFYKLLCFDTDYIDCLILIDEAPDIISHLASMTWKNRLLNIFVRQLRKNHNSLMLGAQQFELIDKSMRWQTDILAQCQDASRRYGWSKENRGKCILLRLLDNSGMWTGETWEQKLERQKRRGTYEDPAQRIQLYPRFMWENDGHVPIFDTFYVMDVFESLRRVDLRLGAYQVGQKQEEVDPASLEWVKRSTPVIEGLLHRDDKAVFTKNFYLAVGSLTTKEKDALGKRLNDCGVRIGQDNTTGKRYYDFEEFNLNKFLGT